MSPREKAPQVRDIFVPPIRTGTTAHIEKILSTLESGNKPNGKELAQLYKEDPASLSCILQAISDKNPDISYTQLIENCMDWSDSPELKSAFLTGYIS